MTADVHLLSGAYALDAVDDVLERRRFERHLAECPGCRDEVRSLQDAVAVLASSAAVTPPAALRSRVLARVAATPQLPPWPAGGPVRRAGARRRPLALAAAVAVLVGGALAGVGGVQLHRAQQADRQAARIFAVAADPAARRVTGTLAGGGSATVLVSAGQAVLVAADVPALAADRAYQVWLVRPGEVVPAALGPEGAAAGGDWSRLIDGVRAGDSVAISVEPPGGSRQPTTTPLTVLTV